MRVRLGRTARPAPPAPTPPSATRTPDAFDLLDVPAAAGHRVVLQLERLGVPLGPVLTVPAPTGHRLYFFVEAGSTSSVKEDLCELGWDPDGLDLRTVSEAFATETALPPFSSPRWVRTPEAERSSALPPAHLLLGSLAYACRRPAMATQAAHRKAA